MAWATTQIAGTIHEHSNAAKAVYLVVWVWLSTARRRGTGHQFLDKSLPWRIDGSFCPEPHFRIFPDYLPALPFLWHRKMRAAGDGRSMVLRETAGQRAFHRTALPNLYSSEMGAYNAWFRRGKVNATGLITDKGVRQYSNKG